MRGETAPYSLVPSSESSLLHEKEGEEVGKIITSDNNNRQEKKRK